MAERLRRLAGKGAGEGEVEEPSRVQGSDEVDLSDAGRALADRAQGDDAGELTPERAEELRQRIEDGVYDSPRVIEETARRILESGDLDVE